MDISQEERGSSVSGQMESYRAQKIRCYGFPDNYCIFILWVFVLLTLVEIQFVFLGGSIISKGVGGERETDHI